MFHIKQRWKDSMGKIKKKKAVIIGAGTYGQVYSKYLSEEYDIEGYFDDDDNLLGKEIDSIPVIGSIFQIDEFINKNKEIAIFVPIGNNKVRVKLLEDFNQLGYNTPSFIHADAKIHNSVIIGKAVYILPASNIMPMTELRDFVMVSMGVNIAHHVIVEKGCFFSQGSNIGASMLLRENAYLGISTTIMTGVKVVGANSLIGAGSVVIRNVEDGVTVVGVPARVIKSNL